MEMTKREQVIKEWERQIAKAEKKLAESTKCYEMFGDEDFYNEWVVADRKRVEELKNNMAKAIAFMDRMEVA
jgi:DNA-binding Lrp family transcriptional regulator